MCCLVLLSLCRWAHIGPHISLLYKSLKLDFAIFQLGESFKREGDSGKKGNPPFISSLPCIARQNLHFLMRNTSQPAVSVCLAVSQGCDCLSFVCRVLPGDIPVCSCCWNSSAGLCLFLSWNKEDSGVLTCTCMKEALFTKCFHTHCK